MKSTPIQVYRTMGYLFGGLCFLLIGYWVKNNLFIFDDKLIISQQQSPHLLIPLPIWCVNVVAGVLLLYTLLLILPNFTVLQQRRFQYAVFCILLFICTLPLHTHLNTARLNDVRGRSDVYSLIIYSVGMALCFRGLLSRYPAFIHTIGSRIFQWIHNISTRTFLVCAVAGTLILCCVISHTLFDGVPGTYDGCMYMFQARLFSHGMLSAEIPPEPQFFENVLVILSDKWYTQFPPGFPAVLTLYQINGIRIVLFFLICYTKHMKNTKHGVSPHFSIEALKQRYMECECPRERMRWHAIWLLADTENPRKPREVAAIVGCTTDCVRKLRRRYNADGEEALRDKRKTNGGRPFLDAPQQASLEKALSAPPIDGGLWTGPKVAAWISGTLKRPVSAVTGWKYLRRLGWTLQRPRPQHQASATPEAQQTFKKKLEARVAALKSEHPEKPVEVWAEDETRLGLLPVHRRVWAKKGVRPTAPVCPAYKWLYGFGFVRPQTGETYWLLMPTVSIEVMNLALAEFARDVNPEAKKQIVLLVDRAGFHTSKAVQVPAGIELFYLPPYSPELQPAERLWPLLREVIANRVLKTLSSLEKVLVNRCQWFSKNWDIVQPHVGFQWICEIEKQYESS